MEFCGARGSVKARYEHSEDPSIEDLSANAAKEFMSQIEKALLAAERASGVSTSPSMSAVPVLRDGGDPEAQLKTLRLGMGDPTHADDPAGGQRSCCGPQQHVAVDWARVDERAQRREYEQEQDAELSKTQVEFKSVTMGTGNHGSRGTAPSYAGRRQNLAHEQEDKQTREVANVLELGNHLPKSASQLSVKHLTSFIEKQEEVHRREEAALQPAVSQYHKYKNSLEVTSDTPRCQVRLFPLVDHGPPKLRKGVDSHHHAHT